MSQFKPGDTVVYVGGDADLDKSGFKIGHKYTAIIHKNYLCAFEGEWGAILGFRGQNEVHAEFFKLDDGLGLSRIEPAPQCNCHAQYSPKGCSDWCNLMPVRKVS